MRGAPPEPAAAETERIRRIYERMAAAFRQHGYVVRDDAVRLFRGG